MSDNEENKITIDKSMLMTDYIKLYLQILLEVWHFLLNSSNLWFSIIVRAINSLYSAFMFSSNQIKLAFPVREELGTPGGGIPNPEKGSPNGLGDATW